MRLAAIFPTDRKLRNGQKMGLKMTVIRTGKCFFLGICQTQFGRLFSNPTNGVKMKKTQRVKGARSFTLADPH